MKRMRSSMVAVLALALTVAFVAAAQAQDREGARRGGGMGMSRGGLLGLLRIDAVRKELKLTDDQAAKVDKAAEELGAQMREKFAALGDIQDQAERRAKMTELSDEADRAAREKLQGILEREQIMRLYQIRMQVRSAAESLANRFVAGRLELTDDQKEKLAQIDKDSQAQRSELMGSMRDATEEQRGELMQKFRALRTEADAKALGVLTDAQKKTFEEMKGEKIELQGPRPSSSPSDGCPEGRTGLDRARGGGPRFPRVGKRGRPQPFSARVRLRPLHVLCMFFIFFGHGQPLADRRVAVEQEHLEPVRVGIVLVEPGEFAKGRHIGVFQPGPPQRVAVALPLVMRRLMAFCSGSSTSANTVRINITSGSVDTGMSP